MASTPPLSYATYQGHRRGQSTSMGVVGKDDEKVGNSSSNGAAPNILPLHHRPTIAHSQPGPTPISTSTTSAASSRTSSSTMGKGDGPPPLRTISSLRSTAMTTASSSRAKGKESIATPSLAVEASSSSSFSSRRTVSSSLTVPSTSTANEAVSLNSASASPTSTESTLPRTNGHNKRHSYSPLPNPHTSLHSRSASNNSFIPPNLPLHISTAQRLRSLDATPSNSSNASSPTGTPRGLSPSLEAMNGTFAHPSSNSHLQPLASETIGRRTAYRPGFQPRGTYRVRTDEFIAARERRKKGSSAPTASNGGDERTKAELESQRLERRLEKLVSLHYDSRPTVSDSLPSWLPNAIRKTRQLAEEEKRIREEEMRIVKWEDDSSRKICSLCSTPFSLSVRKHHCRLCGRIVCASPHLSQLPPGFDDYVEPGRTYDRQADQVKCSSLVIADGASAGAIIKDLPRWEDGDGIMEGAKRGIRICRECREVIMHRQYMLDDGSVPAYLRLYEGLSILQKEIEQSLPEFQEMVLGLQKQDAAAALGTVAEPGEDILSPSRSDSSTLAASSLAALKAKNKNTLALQRDAAQARKQLLANFANYDLIAKKIRNLDDQGNASLARIKLAIWTKANLFLQQNMFPLQSLPKLTTNKKEKKKQSSGVSTPISSEDLSDAGETVRPFRSVLEDGSKGTATQSKNAKADAQTLELVQRDPKAAKESLIVLEQQLSLVLEYAASAARARKFQDAKSLRSSAQDLEVEIARLRKLGIS